MVDNFFQAAFDAWQDASCASCCEAAANDCGVAWLRNRKVSWAASQARLHSRHRFNFGLYAEPLSVEWKTCG